MLTNTDTILEATSGTPIRLIFETDKEKTPTEIDSSHGRTAFLGSRSGVGKGSLILPDPWSWTPSLRNPVPKNKTEIDKIRAGNLITNLFTSKSFPSLYLAN